MPTTTSITLKSQDDNTAVLIPSDAGKDQRSRLTRFVGWLDSTGQQWSAPDLAAYRDYLQMEHGLSPASTSAHLSSVRGQYGRIIRDNATRDKLYQMTPANVSASDRKAFVDEALERLKNAVDPQAAPVKTITVQDRPDAATGLRLSRTQAGALIEAPGVDTLMALRDTAMISLMLCTGIREMELCRLDVADLRQTFGGALALHVREGKGAKERMIPYGALDWCLAYVEAWLTDAGITTGPVFRGFYRGGKSVRATRLTVRAVNQVLDRYPVSVDGQPQTVNPHDLRRTYARRLYDAQVDILAIQQNLGHSDHKTTLKYIGIQDAEHRQPPALYPVNLARLAKRKLIA